MSMLPTDSLDYHAYYCIIVGIVYQTNLPLPISTLIYEPTISDEKHHVIDVLSDCQSSSS